LRAGIACAQGAQFFAQGADISIQRQHATQQITNGRANHGAAQVVQH
jgi:hypothetical protein